MGTVPVVGDVESSMSDALRVDRATQSQYFHRSTRLGFRWWTDDDFTLAGDLWSDPRVTRFLGGPWSDDQIKQRFARERENHKSHQIQYWPIFLLATADHVGCCGLKPYDIGKFPEHVRREVANTDARAFVLELGFHLRESHWGQGYAEEAAQAVIRYAFTEIDPAPSALFAGHHPENTASRRVLQNLGFQYSHDEHFPPSGLMHRGYVLKPEGFIG